MRICLIFLAMLGFHALHSQSLDRSVIGAAGRTNAVGTQTIHWTIGEMSVVPLTSGNTLLTQGFQQPKTSECTFFLGNDTLLCSGQLLLDAGNAQSYDWSNGTATQTITVTQSGSYSVTVTNANGCTASDEISIQFLPVTESIDTTLCEGDTLLVGGQVFTNDTSFVETLVAMAGCDSVIRQANLVFLPQDSCHLMPPIDCTSKIPNVVVPGCNCEDEVFDPVAYLEACKGEMIERSITELTIINRWGEAIFRAKPYQPWNGRNGVDSGQQLPQGAYYYTLIKGAGGNNKRLKGVVNLLILN